MASVAFTYPASYTASQASRPSTRIVRFADGYEQRLTFGLNADLKVWSLQFNTRTNDQTAQIKGFFEARRGVESFSWTDPYGAIGYYVCEEWNVAHVSFNNNDISAVFRQVISLQ